MITKEDLKLAVNYLFKEDKKEYPIKIEMSLMKENIQRYLIGEMTSEELMLTKPGDAKLTFYDNGN
jgi:hypothetical protein